MVKPEWRDNAYGHKLHALYLGTLYVGEIMQSTHPAYKKGQWRAWYMNDDEGSELGWYDTDAAARMALEEHLIVGLAG